MIRTKNKLKASPRVVVKHLTVTNHPQAAELRQWLYRTVRTPLKNGTNTKARA